MTHAELVARAARWLKNTKRCGFVLREHVSRSREIPDAIGWTNGGKWSYLVECKTSKSDFYADKHKPGRTLSDLDYGVGRERYYLADRGVLSTELIQKHRSGWGLLEIRGKIVKVVLPSLKFSTRGAFWELPLLYSYARRVQWYGFSLNEVEELLSQKAMRGVVHEQIAENQKV